MLVLRAEAVLGQMHRGAGRQRDLRGQAAVRPAGPQNVGAAMEIEDGA